MSTTTGATEAQIEAAIQTKLSAWGIPDNQRNHEWTDYRLATEQVAAVVSYLVPPGMVIASAADVATVPTAEEIAAISNCMLIAEDKGEEGEQGFVRIVRAYLERVTE